MPGEKRFCCQPGFTLIELVVVIFIIAMTSALVLPSFWDMGEKSLISEAKRLRNNLSYIYDESISKKQVFVVRFDLDDDLWEYRNEQESRSFKMKRDVMFGDISVPSLGMVSAGEVILKFGPLGPEEPITIHLVQDDNYYTVTLNHVSGRSKIYKGYE